MTPIVGRGTAGHDGSSAFPRELLRASLIGGASLLPVMIDRSTGGGLTWWIWLALWAPACGALLVSTTSRRWLLLPVALCALALLLGVGEAPARGMGAAAVLGLYLLGAATGSTRNAPYALASCWLFAAGLFAALPSAAGVWHAAPGSTWLVATLDLSPVVWVCETAGFDWMRHSSVYEAAGAGDLGPHERLAWAGWFGPLLLCAVAALALGARFWQASRADSGRA